MRRCLDCAEPLKPGSLERPGGAAPLEFCSCGGVWLAHGVLERVLGVDSLTFTPLGGETSRRCPDCTLSLTTVVLREGIPVECCSACRGVWLDWPDILDLRVKDLQTLVQPPRAADRYAGLVPDEPRAGPSLTGFACAKCGRRVEFSEGSATSRGLVCDRCAPEVQPVPRMTDLILPDDE